MPNSFETKFTGWTFIVSAILLIGGWVMLPHHVGEFFKPEDFAAIGENLWYWIWMYRFHVFGWVTMGMALIAFGMLTNRSPQRIVLLPGLGVVVVGAFALALGFAFYYTFGAWGVGQTAGMDADQLQAFTDQLVVTNQYFTCVIRFGRIFSGAGLAVVGFGLLYWNVMDRWIAWYTILLGVAAMGVILFVNDNHDFYFPLFYLKGLWMVLIGAVLLTKGLNNAPAAGETTG